MEQVLDFEKVSEFNFLNEEVEKFTSRWSQRLADVRNPSHFKQKSFDFFHEA